MSEKFREYTIVLSDNEKAIVEDMQKELPAICHTIEDAIINGIMYQIAKQDGKVYD